MCLCCCFSPGECQGRPLWRSMNGTVRCTTTISYHRSTQSPWRTRSRQLEVDTSSSKRLVNTATTEIGHFMVILSQICPAPTPQIRKYTNIGHEEQKLHKHAFYNQYSHCAFNTVILQPIQSLCIQYSHSATNAVIVHSIQSFCNQCSHFTIFPE